MFKLAQKTAPFSHDVIVPEVNDNGTIVKHKIRFLFNRMTRTELDQKESALKDSMGFVDSDRLTAQQTIEHQVERAMIYCADWKDVTTPEGEPLEFNRDNLFALFNSYPGAYPALFDTYVRLVFNNGEALQKN
jgi:Phage tail assembly chaperone